MAKKKNGFDTTMLLKYADQLESLGGSTALKRAAEGGMLQTKQVVNEKLTAAMRPGNLPAGGKYSTGDTMASIDKSMAVNWQGNLGEIPLGFDMKKSGITSIMLMHGTPKMQPVPGLYDALYGQAVRREARKAQEEAIKTIIERLGK